jgi:drug/metabolite transporter (DMT)-like permease
MNARPYLTLLIGVLAVSFASVFIRLADAPALVIAASRLILASIILLPFAATKSAENIRHITVREFYLVLLSSFFLAVHFALWITSLSYTTIASSVILVTSHPTIVAILSYFLWHEKLSKLNIAGIAAALVGVAVINYGDFALNPRAVLGDAMALAGSFAVAGYLIIGRQIGKRINALGYLTLVYTCSGLMLLIVLFITGERLSGYSNQTYLMLLLLALVPQLIGHSALNLAVRTLPVTLVSVAILGEPIGATLLGAFILKELPKVNEIAGGLLIIAGIYMVLRKTAPKQPKQNTQ